jgi:hypothetical protein
MGAHQSPSAAPLLPPTPDPCCSPSAGSRRSPLPPPPPSLTPPPAARPQGLLALPYTAEIYPVGGAGDRLGLKCEVTGEPLPSAMLPYAGRTMIELLLRDLVAREYLYWHLTGRQVGGSGVPVLAPHGAAGGWGGSTCAGG